MEAILCTWLERQACGTLDSWDIRVSLFVNEVNFFTWYFADLHVNIWDSGINEWSSRVPGMARADTNWPFNNALWLSMSAAVTKKNVICHYNICPSSGLVFLPWLVTKKFHSQSSPKSSLCWRIFAKFLNCFTGHWTHQWVKAVYMYCGINWKCTHTHMVELSLNYNVYNLYLYENLLKITWYLCCLLYAS